MLFQLLLFADNDSYMGFVKYFSTGRTAAAAAAAAAAALPQLTDYTAPSIETLKLQQLD
jgi:cobalamin biosynthesis protein CbiD